MNLPLHVQVDGFEVKDGCLCVGGKKVTDIARELGSTPFYAYDRRLIIERIETLRRLVPREIDLHYAIKANPMPEVVDLISGYVDGLDVASKGELGVALATSCQPNDMSFAGPGKTVEELTAAIEAGITINVESPTELERIAELSPQLNRRPNVAIRVNPDFELKSSGMRMSGGPKQFGIDAETVPDILRRLGDLPVRFAGFHIFSGSQNLRAEAICESQDKAVQLAAELTEFAPNPPEILNIGGGFGIPYFPGDQPLDLPRISDNLQNLVETTKSKIPGAKLVLELGRFLVGEAGVYVCRVLDKKVSRGHVFLVTDGGLHHHLAASGNFGQVLRKNYPVVIANRASETNTENASVVGPLCTPLDLLADKMDLAESEVGDLVAVFQSGAYGYTASPHLFLGHPPPKQVLV